MVPEVVVAVNETSNGAHPFAVDTTNVAAGGGVISICFENEREIAPSVTVKVTRNMPVFWKTAPGFGRADWFPFPKCQEYTAAAEAPASSLVNFTDNGAHPPVLSEEKLRENCAEPLLAHRR